MQWKLVAVTLPYHKQIFVIIVANEDVLHAATRDPGCPLNFGQASHTDFGTEDLQVGRKGEVSGTARAVCRLAK